MRSHVSRLDRVALAVQPMLLDPLRLQRPERVEADMQRDALDVEPVEQLRREVQPGRRRGGGAALACVDRSGSAQGPAAAP